MDCQCHSKEQSTCIELVPIFSNLTKEEMLEVAAITRSKAFEKNERIYSAGDKGGKLFVLRSGRVKIYRLTANGKEQVIRVVEPREFMGELSLFSSLPLTDHAEALEPSTLCIIEGEKLKALMKKYPSIAFKILEELSQRLERAESLIETISLYTVEQRLAQALIDMSADTEKVILNMSKGDFASQLGMSQETLSRKLTALQEAGLIEVKGRREIIILDRAGLESIISN